ncbi:MAG: glycosyltransferase family 2 protein [Bryobacteraceae bacterium]
MNTPRVSIGLPIYNGSNFMRETIDSVLRQTFTDWELVICDNASTDATPEICREYAARDSRIRFYANAKNMGAAYNYDRVLELSRGEYFKWTAHDDLMAPDFLEKCAGLLDSDRSAIGAAPQAAMIDESGQILREPWREVSMSSERPSERYRQQLTDAEGFRQIFGLYRTPVVRNCGPNGRWGSSDKNFLARLSLQGKILVTDTVLYSRVHPLQSVNAHTSTHARSIWFDPKLAGKIHFPRFSMVWDYLSAVFAYPMPFSERLRATGYWLRHMHWPGLAKDVAVAGLTLAHRALPGRWEPDQIIDPTAKRRTQKYAQSPVGLEAGKKSR